MTKLGLQEYYSVLGRYTCYSKSSSCICVVFNCSYCFIAEKCTKKRSCSKIRRIWPQQPEKVLPRLISKVWTPVCVWSVVYHLFSKPKQWIVWLLFLVIHHMEITFMSLVDHCVRLFCSMMQLWENNTVLISATNTAQYIFAYLYSKMYIKSFGHLYQLSDSLSICLALHLPLLSPKTFEHTSSDMFSPPGNTSWVVPPLHYGAIFGESEAQGKALTICFW